MAISFTSERGGTNGVASTAASATYATASYTPATNSLLIAWANVTATVTTPGSYSGNGLTWTSIGTRQVSSHRHYLFYALTGSSPTATAGTMNVTGDNGTGCVQCILEFAGTHLSSPIVQSKSNFDTSGTSAAPSITFDTAVTAGNAVAWFAGGHNANPAAGTMPTGFTEEFDTGYNTPTTGGFGGYHLSPSGSTFTGALGIAQNWGCWAVEIQPPAAAGTEDPFPITMRGGYYPTQG